MGDRVANKMCLLPLYTFNVMSLKIAMVIRPWSVDSLDGGFFTSQFGPVGRSGK